VSDRQGASQFGDGAEVEWVCRLLDNARLEILPTAKADEIAKGVPERYKLTVTSSPKLGVARTVELATELRRRGFTVVPHLAARAVRDRHELARIIDTLVGAGIDEVFVIGGDQEQPVGAFSGALELLEVLSTLDRRPQTIGVAAYPEGHPKIPSSVLMDMLLKKQPYATYAILQLSFDAGAILDWLRAARSQGFHLPVYLCLPGTLRIDRLLRIAVRLGIGQSLRYLEKQQGLLPQLLTGGYRYDPWTLIESLLERFGPDHEQIVGIHWSTFNELTRTVEWIESRQRELRVTAR